MYWGINKKIRIVYVLLLVALLLSCGILEFENEQDSPKVLFPLAVGNYWEYEYTYLGTIFDTLRYDVVQRIEVPISDTTYISYAFNLVPFHDGAPEFYWLYRNGKNGFYLMGGISEVDTLYINELQRPFPFKAGDTFLEPRLSFSYSRHHFYHSDTLKVTLIDTEREITTPAGTFNCYVYKFTVEFFEEGVPFTAWDYYQYYRPGIGLIAQIAISQKGENEIKEEMYLMNYNIKK